jgi:hypothetical protein
VLSQTGHLVRAGQKCIEASPGNGIYPALLHHYRDMNSIYLLYSRGLKLSLFSDIYFYLQSAKPDAGNWRETF